MGIMDKIITQAIRELLEKISHKHITILLPPEYGYDVMITSCKQDDKEDD